MRRAGASLVVLLVCTPGCLLDRSGTAPADAASPLDAGLDALVAPGCGDGVRAADEECDGDDLGGATCVSRGFARGPLGCDAACRFDTSRCDTPCGNGRVDPGEQCDGADVGGAGCASLGLSGGPLTCNANCTFDPRSCLGCGNGRVESGEECDGVDLGPLSCTGSLGCAADCTLDTSGCAVPSAGDAADGDLVVTASTVFGPSTGAPAYAVAAAAADRLTLHEAPAGIAAGDEVIVWAVHGAPGACAAAGRWGTYRVGAVSGQDVVLTTPLGSAYGLDVLTPHAVVMQRLPRFGLVAVRGSAALSVAPWDGARGGLIAFRARELIVEAGATLGADARGFRGGAGWSGQNRTSGRRGGSICGDPQDAATEANGGGGGGGRYGPGAATIGADACGQGGGGGAYGGAGTSRGFGTSCNVSGGPAGNGGQPNGMADLSVVLHLGSGGGAGATDEHSNQSGAGGAGGGAVIVWTARARIDGVVSARGGDGAVPGDFTDSGNGGGGAGGAVQLWAVALDGEGRIDAGGGLGAPARNVQWNGPGGDGGEGRVALGFFTVGDARYGSADAMARAAAWSTPRPGHLARFLD
ncbi:MAG: hypothetical protein KF729_37625 [Sandaracinaceae bacterium]|nr:hypothetical protein [Sandaracinaceae bacterium]